MPHPTDLGPSAEALRLHKSASRWVERNRGDGFVPIRRAYASGDRHAHRSIFELIEAGLWQARPGGYQVATARRSR
jgi:hypothetical protein